jgi:hypothetical protein
MENHATIMQGFKVLRSLLAGYIGRELSLEHGDKMWWQESVMGILYDDQKRNLPQSGDFSELTDSLDVANCLLLFDLHWQRVFRKKLSVDHRTWAKELMGFRNKTAHIGGKDFSDDDTWRALDTMSRLCEQIDGESAEEIRGLLRISRYGSADGSTNSAKPSAARIVLKPKKAGILSAASGSALPSWRDVIEPHPDVAQGRYKNAEFAADLAQVARGGGALDPIREIKPSTTI